MHDWTDDYREASIASVILSPRDLREVARDVGIQMGRAHPKRPDGAPDKARRKAVLESLNAIEARVRAAIRQLAKETEAAWRGVQRNGEGARGPVGVPELETPSGAGAPVARLSRKRNGPSGRLTGPKTTKQLRRDPGGASHPPVHYQT